MGSAYFCNSSISTDSRSVLFSNCNCQEPTTVDHLKYLEDSFTMPCIPIESKRELLINSLESNNNSNKVINSKVSY